MNYRAERLYTNAWIHVQTSSSAHEQIVLITHRGVDGQRCVHCPGPERKAAGSEGNKDLCKTLGRATVNCLKRVLLDENSQAKTSRATVQPLPIHWILAVIVSLWRFWSVMIDGLRFVAMGNDSEFEMKTRRCRCGKFMSGTFCDKWHQHAVSGMTSWAMERKDRHQDGRELSS